LGETKENTGEECDRDRERAEVGGQGAERGTERKMKEKYKETSVNTRERRRTSKLSVSAGRATLDAGSIADGDVVRAFWPRSPIDSVVRTAANTTVVAYSCQIGANVARGAPNGPVILG